MIRDQPDWSLVGEAADAVAAVDLALQLTPDVIILDIGLPKHPKASGLEAARQIRSVTNVKVLMLATQSSDDVGEQSFEAGAQGVILKSDPATELIRAVEAVALGKRYLAPRLEEKSSQVPAHHAPSPAIRAELQPEVTLTPRELELVRHLCSGAGNKETATVMGFSVRTVETYRAAVKAKLGVRSTAEIIRWAIRNRLIEP